jgi:hypothetical protein
MKGVGVASALVLVFGSFLFVGCDGSDSGGGITEAQLPVCGPNTFRLTGTIDNMSIDVTEPGAGGFSQDDAGGELDLGDPLGTGSEMKLVWRKGLLDGQSGAATGSFVLASGAFSGQSFCAGTGTEVLIPKDQSRASIQFVVTGLASGDACSTVRTGTLQGCLR